MDLSIKAIDCVVNPITPEIMATPPAVLWTVWKCHFFNFIVDK